MNQVYWSFPINDLIIRLPLSEELNDKQYVEALDEIEKFVKLQPSSDAYALRGRIHFLAGKYDKAIADYEHSIRLKGDLKLYQKFTEDQDRVCFDRASAFLKLDKPKEALDIYVNYVIENINNHEKEDKVNQVSFLGGGLAIAIKEYALAKGFYELTSLNGINQSKDVYFKLVDESECKDKKLQEKDRELEEMMSMFAHKFRSPLDTIIYNTNHEHQPKLYIQAAQTMRGLLDIFSIISADDIVLIEKLKRDNQGESGLLTVFSKTLDMILLHLLSAQAAEKIQQHYLRYAKKHELCDAKLSYKQWNEDYFELERQLQTEWEQSFAELLSQQATLEQRLAWLEQRFFKLELQGFEQANIQFKEYGITESFLTILLNEILVNAFKYYSSDTQQPVVLAWAESDSYQVLSCRNPSARHERDRFKGSGKGHTFLSALARKTGSQFTKPKPQDDFVLEFGIANQLLISS